MHEVNRRIGFQEVAPNAPCLVRLAGYEQHAQPVAHTGNRHRGAIVRERQLFRPRRGLDHDHVLAAPFDLHRQRRILARFHANALGRAAIQRYLQLHFAAARVFHTHHKIRTLADNAEIRRIDDPNASVAPVLLAGDEAMQRADQRFDTLRVRKIVDLPVRNQDRARNPVTRHIRHEAFERAVEIGPVIARIGLQRAHFQRLVLGKARLQRGIGRVRRRLPVAELHALRPVKDDRCHRGQGLALFMHEGWIEQRRGE